MTLREIWGKEPYRVAFMAISLWLLCLGALYVYYQFFPSQKHEPASLIPYGILSVWYLWVFLHNRILIRKFLFQNRIASYLGGLVVGISAAAGIHMVLLNASAISTNETFSDAIWALSFYTVVGSLIFLAFSYLRERKNFYQLSALKREVELQQVKSQLNPHFLFNSLNNIYSYNLENNTFGNDLILKLSQLMRFIVETSTKETISLKEEITFIENYLSFENERLGYRCNIVFKTSIRNLERKIPPLILFPFIENAIKHSTSTISYGNVDVLIEDSQNVIDMSVKNAIADINRPSTKTGLSNARRRLELLFPGRHQLKIGSSRNEFHVNLNIQLE